MNLRDFIWETEEHKFEPKENRHRSVTEAKTRENEKKVLQKEKRKNQNDIPQNKYRRKREAAEHADHMGDFMNGQLV